MRSQDTWREPRGRGIKRSLCFPKWNLPVDTVTRKTPLSVIRSTQSTTAILKENMDLYMLNPCSKKIWCVLISASPSVCPQMSQFCFCLLLNPTVSPSLLLWCSGSLLSSVSPSRWSSWTSPTLNSSLLPRKTFLSPLATGMCTGNCT